MVVVGRLAAHVDHGVDRRRAADHLAARIGEAAAVEARLRLGLEHPVRARIADREQIADRNVEPDPVVAAAGFQQQHALAGIGGQPVGQHAAGRARADDDVVVFAFDRCRRPALAPIGVPYCGLYRPLARLARLGSRSGAPCVRCVYRNGGSERSHQSELFRPCPAGVHIAREENRHARDDVSSPLLAFLAVARSARRSRCVAQEQITVFAAASMKNALDDINAAFTKATGIKVVASYAASSALAKQIEHGAPADMFISADLEWMDYGARRSSSRTTPASICSATGWC